MNTFIIKTIAIGIAICSLAACAEENDSPAIGPCGQRYVDFYRSGNLGLECPIVEFAGQELIPGTIYYEYRTTEAGTRVQFTTGGTADNICNKEHLTASFFYEIKLIEQTVPMKIFGKAFWDPFVGDEEIILADGFLSFESIRVSVPLEIGLKQAFPNEAGTVELYTTVEFETQGGLDQDIAYLQNHIYYFGVESRYSLFE